MCSNPDITTAPQRASWFQRMFASAMASSAKTQAPNYEVHKRRLFSDLHGDVLEIGPGTAPNLTYYPKDVRWIGIDPNPAMLPYAHEEAQRLGMSVQLREGQAEQLGVPDESVDAVVSTLVLCSVHDQHEVLQEIKRVLKPGGRFVFIEHVAAPQKTGLRFLQRIIKPLWRSLTEGCHPDRETWTAIEQAGFSRVQIDHFRLNLPIVGPHIAGYAVK